jgi:MHS family proline/betaine transporter-like MFS transporter
MADMVITRRASRLKVAVAANIGAAFEWYDLVLYAMFAVTLSKQFFHAADSATSVLLSLGTFAIAWLVRPLGAILIGAYSDKAGRKPGLTLSALLMMIGTGMTALLPNYDAIGVAAPILLVLARMIQGFSAGGEFGSATALLAEQDPNRRGFYASLQWAASGLAVLTASLFAYAINASLSSDQVALWGWRIPFLFGLLIGPAAWYIRTKLDEPEEFLNTPHSRAPLLEVMTLDKRRVLAGAGIVAAGAAGSYMNNYMPTYAITQMHLPASSSLLGTIVGGVINTFLPPLFGHLSDRYGRIRIMGLFGAIGMVMIYPLFRWLVASPHVETLIAIQALLALIFYCGYYSTVPVALADLYPTRRRTTGVSISYVLAQLCFGGVTPLATSWLINVTGDATSPGIYLTAVAALSLLCLIPCRRFGVR